MVKSLNRKEKRKQGSLKKKKSTKNKYQLASMPTSIRIIKESKEQFNEMLKSTDRPLLNRLFRKENINKFSKTIQDNGFLSLFRRSRGRDINASCGSLANKKSVGNG